jgi:double-stranded uracil-DNA glycosylase
MPNDVLTHGLEVVFCGITDGESSSDSTFFYDGPGNNFYNILYKTGFTPIKLHPEQSDEINQYQIGLSDLNEKEDADDIEDYDASDFVAKMLDQRPRFVAFTSRKAAACCLEYLNVNGTVKHGLQDWRIGVSRVFLLVLPPGNEKRFWNEKYWQQLKELIDKAQKSDMARIDSI